MKKSRLAVFLALALLAAVAHAQTMKAGAPVWRYAEAGGVEGRSIASCQTAVDMALADVARRIAPLTIVQTSSTTCPANVAAFSVDYRDSGQTPTVPNRTIGLTGYCEGHGVLGPPFGPDPVVGYYCQEGPSITVSRRNIGRCTSCGTSADVGNPIQPGFGNKIQIETDYVGPGPYPLKLERIYNSARGNFTTAPRFGAAWSHTYFRRLHWIGTDSTALQYVSAQRPDGRTQYFNRTVVGGPFSGDADNPERLERTATGWKLANADDEIELYDAQGVLQSLTNRAGLTQALSYFASGPNAGLLEKVTDAFGRTLSFEYNNIGGTVSAVVDPAGGRLEYSYVTNSGAEILTSIKYQDNKTRTYHREDPNNGRLLTGITDENGVRFATWAYVSSFGIGPRAWLSNKASDGSETVAMVYQSDGSTDIDTYVSPSSKATRHYTFQVNLGVIRNNAITGPACPSCGPAARTYDANGNLASSTDWNGNRTNYSWDLARVLETQRVEGLTAAGATTPQTRTITTQYHATFRLPTSVAEPLRITSYTYDAQGNMLTKSIQANTDADGSQGLSATSSGAPRTWTWTYNANGQVLIVDGPRTDLSDVTTYTYYANDDADINKRGNVASVTDAAGHTTQITAYNAHGQPLTIVDPNGLTTTLTYDARRRLKSRDVGGELTSYDYDGVGQLTKVTLPDGSFLSYSYDAAHRLTAIQDNLGNRIAYTLDLAGNRTKEEVFDPANVLAQTRSRVYSNINRLFQELGAAGQTTEYAYDNQGNVTSVKDPLNQTTSNQYDPLNRLKQVTDPGLGVTQYGYNGLDALTQVTDPRALATSYTLDGLGNLTQQVSPDTGTTSNTYDTAGNLLTQTDAKNQTTTYAYDALNRVTLITFHDGSKQAYAYDQGTNGLGRLSSITETNPASQITSQIAYAYDQKGRVTSETRTVAGVSHVLAYQYDSSGRLSGLTYPSGRTITYGFDLLGRVNQISTTKDAQTQVVVQNVQYHPFGGAKSWTLGNGQIYSRTIDQDGRISAYTLGASSYAIGFDAASRITAIGANTYGYDSLDRLTSAVLPSSNYAYSYDAVGNRLSKTTGANSDSYTYSSTSNRIATLTPFGSPSRSFIFDANGSTTDDGVNQYAYDTRGRMSQATSTAGTTAYQVNALGQRIRKTNSQGDTVFTYDTWGKLIAESDPGGAPKREYIYLGDIPVGVVQ